MDFCTGDREHIDYLYRDPLFDKCLKDLRAKGGECLVAARKADEFIDILLHQDRRGEREKFRFTRNGEARIKHCKKVDLGCGYRIVCIKKDGHLALIYMGTHDDCFRWIERNRGMKYDVAALKGAIRIDHEERIDRDNKLKSVIEEEKIFRAYEEILMSRLSDEVLRRVFSGLCQKPMGGQ